MALSMTSAGAVAKNPSPSRARPGNGFCNLLQFHTLPKQHARRQREGIYIILRSNIYTPKSGRAQRPSSTPPAMPAPDVRVPAPLRAVPTAFPATAPGLARVQPAATARRAPRTGVRPARPEAVRRPQTEGAHATPPASACRARTSLSGAPQAVLNRTRQEAAACLAS